MVKYTLMSQKTLVKTAAKDILARAMAMEDITVEHRADAPSAYFDTKNRVLCLPVWKQMDNSVYDMLVGHEVSHALHTPADGWQEFCKEDGNRHMFLNIVEDARIERLIKDKFPGLRRDFASAYKTLHDSGLFELDGKNLSELPLIDRLNLEFKLGLFGLVDVPFSADEQQYVKRMADTKTFDEVMELAKELYDLWKEEEDQKESEEGAGAPSDGSESGEGSGKGSDSDTSDDDTFNAGESGDGNEESDDVNRGAGEGQDGEDSGASAEDDTDDGESAESQDGDAGNSDAGELGADQYEANQYQEPSVGETQSSFEQGIEELRDGEASEHRYHTLPTMNLDRCVVDWKTINEDLDYHYNRQISGTATGNPDYIESQVRHRTEAMVALNKFLQKSKPTVNHMVQQFQMKQAADADKRTDIAKTGVLDTTTMVNYRWSEDIFVKNEVHSDGKSHGMVLFVDWSGSMASILQDTVEQLLILVEFCRKAGIPFEVYGFSSNQFLPSRATEKFDRYSQEYTDYIEKLQSNPQYTKNREDNIEPHAFQLYQWLTSDMNARQFKHALQNFWYVADAQRTYRSSIPRCYSLGCTPLNEAILCAFDIVPAFQSRNGIQIVNTVVLSDGEGHGIGLRGYSRNETNILRDQKSHKTYNVDTDQRGCETDVLIQCLKDRTGCNTISIRLHDSNKIDNLRWTYWSDCGTEEGHKIFTKACSDFKKLNFTTAPETGYDEYFIVKGDLKVEFDALESIGDDASYTKIKNAFMKGNSSKKSSRVIASRIIDIIAA